MDGRILGWLSRAGCWYWVVLYSYLLAASSMGVVELS